MAKNVELSRRGFIATGTVAGVSLLCPTPVERLFHVLSNGLIGQAQAEARGNTEGRNYINLLLPGGPTRYVFDAFMRVADSDPQLLFNPMVTTRFTNSGGKVSGVEYATFKFNGVLVPHFFSHQVQNSKGGMRPLTDLLQNMLVIRGYGSGFDGHAFNSTVQQAPVGGVSSISGLAADYSSATFEAVEWPDRGGYGSFYSAKGKALNKLNGNPLNALLQGFGPPPTARLQARTVKERNREAYDLAQARLKAYAQSEFAGAQIVAKNLSNATELMKKGIGNIDSYWTSAVSRYRSVIEASLRATGLVGISDFPLISDEGNFWGVHVADGNRRLLLSSDFDFRESIKTMTVPDFLAEGLAMAEYVIREGLVSCFNFHIGDPTNLTFKDKENGMQSTHLAIKDMHETGAVASLFIMNAYYRAIASGLLELIDQLRSTRKNNTDLWSETVVQVLSEFNRSARSSGSGSDHGFNQMVTSVFSGAFSNGPIVVGNISRAGHNEVYSGTQGIGAEIDDYNQKGRPSPAMAASTIAAVLGVSKNPYENIAAPLVELSGDQLRALKLAKIVG